jgi:uncharacterized protein (TIGR02270 family)
MDLGSARAWHDRLSKEVNSLRLAVIGAGVIGDPSLVPWLFEQMELPRLARVAGEAFTMITGADFAYNNLDSEKPDGFESGPNDDPADEDVAMDPDENLPWPDMKKVEAWWGKHRAEFSSGMRYLTGKPMTIEGLEQVLRIGKQRQRAAAALELAIRQPEKPLFEVRAPGFRQQKLLSGRS